MMASAAWQSLTAQDRCVLIEVLRRYFGGNNGWIGLSVRDAAKGANVSKDTAARSLHRLQERGFLECVTPGGFSRKTRHATEWRITAHHCDRTRTRASRAFMDWRPPQTPERGPKAGRHGPKRGTLGPNSGSERPWFGTENPQ
jgi:hypothetical protein